MARIKLIVEDEVRDILSFSTYYFYPDPGYKIYLSPERVETYKRWGKIPKDYVQPCSPLLKDYDRHSPNAFIPAHEQPFGGLLRMMMESTGNDDFFYNRLKVRGITHGRLEFFNAMINEDMPFRRLEFWDGWICSLEETMSSSWGVLMLLHLEISPATVRVNKSVVLQKNWFITKIPKFEYRANLDKWANEQPLVNKSKPKHDSSNSMAARYLGDDTYLASLPEVTIKGKQSRHAQIMSNPTVKKIHMAQKRVLYGEEALFIYSFLPVANVLTKIFSGAKALLPTLKIAKPAAKGLKSLGAAATKSTGKTLQVGEHTLKKSTLEALGLSKEQGKTAIEALKKANQLPPDAHYKIIDNGDIYNPHTGEFIDNLLDYAF